MGRSNSSRVWWKEKRTLKWNGGIERERGEKAPYDTMRVGPRWNISTRKWRRKTEDNGIGPIGAATTVRYVHPSMDGSMYRGDGMPPKDGEREEQKGQKKQNGRKFVECFRLPSLPTTEVEPEPTILASSWGPRGIRPDLLVPFSLRYLVPCLEKRGKRRKKKKVLLYLYLPRHSCRVQDGRVYDAFLAQDPIYP